MSTQQEKPPRPWYKEPWTWGLMAGPAAAVVAGLFTYHLAVSSPNDLVTDDYYKEGKNIILQMERDERAIARNMEAQVYVQPNKDGVLVIVSGRYDPAVPLQLLFIHPTLKANDLTVNLVQTAGAPSQYTAQWSEPLPASNNWIVRLQDAQNNWRIEKRWIVSQGDAITLVPQRMGQ